MRAFICLFTRVSYGCRHSVIETCPAIMSQKRLAGAALKDEISRLEKEIADGPKSKHALAKHLRKTMTQRLKGLQEELRAEEATSQKEPSPRS